MHLPIGTTFVTSSTPNTYTKITGGWTDGHSNNYIIDSANNRLTYIGATEHCALFNGVSSIIVDKGGVITYGLYQTNAFQFETPVEISNSAKAEALAASKIVRVLPNDYFEVWVKADSASVTITMSTLNILLFGEF